jgi:hypothetical protein
VLLLIRAVLLLLLLLLTLLLLLLPLRALALEVVPPPLRRLLPRSVGASCWEHDPYLAHALPPSCAIVFTEDGDVQIDGHRRGVDCAADRREWRRGARGGWQRDRPHADRVRGGGY